MPVQIPKRHNRDSADVTMRWLGAWSGTTNYEPGDCIASSGTVYICVVLHSNHVPPNATYWQST